MAKTSVIKVHIMAKKRYKEHICSELDARKMIISFCKRSPQVLWAYTFKDVYLISVQSSRTRAIKLKKNLKREEMEKGEKENEQ